MLYAKEQRIFRCLSLLFSGWFIVLAIMAFFLGILPRSESSNFAWDYQPRLLSRGNESQVTHAICNSFVKGLTIQQVGLIAESAAEFYLNESELNRSLFSPMFGFDQFEDRETPFPDAEFGSYLRHIYLVDRKLHVFAVRGTVTFVDVMVDLELFCAAVFLEIFLPYVPFIGQFNYIAHDYFSMLVAMPRVVFRPFSLTDRYVRNMYTYVKHARVEEGEDVLITGHSLGGGITKILALMTGYAAVAWSGPGTRALEYVYRTPDKTITPRNLINVVPDQDWVGAVDQWDGTTYKLPCRAGPLLCHDLPLTICQIAAMCGNLEEQRLWCELWLKPREMEQIAENAAPHHVQFN
jgi:hypothetical protein